MREADVGCRRCASPFEAGDLRCAVCGHVAPDAIRVDIPKAAVEILRCSSCGAAVSYSVRARAPECAFCGSVVHVEVPDDPMEQEDLVLPFTVDRARAQAVFRDWLGSLGWFRPGDLRSASRLESVRPLWWVGWAVSAEAVVSWTADSEVGAVRADWAPHSGQTEVRFDDIVVSASRGLSGEETAQLVPSYDLTTARARAAEEDGDAVVEQFEVRRTVARRQVRAELKRLASKHLKDGVIPGRRVRHLHTSLLVRKLLTRRIGFPAWVIAYRYRGSLHRFVLSGQDPSCLLGDAPRSTARVLLAIAVAIGGLAALLALLAHLVS